jgi:hypothetical protein
VSLESLKALLKACARSKAPTNDRKPSGQRIEDNVHKSRVKDMTSVEGHEAHGQDHAIHEKVESHEPNEESKQRINGKANIFDSRPIDVRRKVPLERYPKPRVLK